VELLEELRGSPRTAHLPVMMLSTEAAVRQRLDGLSRGANDYVGKPYDPAYVVKRSRELTQMPEEDGMPRLVSAGRRRRVLVVDSSYDFSHQAVEALRRDGHDVILARTGDEALRLVDAQPVDCVLVDMEDATTGGVDTARSVRAMQARVPLLGMAGHLNAKMMSEALAVGVDTFFSKADSLDMLRVQVRNELRRRVEDEASPPSGSYPSVPAAKAPVLSSAKAPSTPPAPAPAAPSAPKAAPSSFFDEVVARSGLSPVIGPSTISRACRRAGVDPQMLNAVNLARVLPSLRNTLGIFLDEKEVEQRMQALQGLARQSRQA
jgi:DNA-binding response OmpR family regulator